MPLTTCLLREHKTSWIDDHDTFSRTKKYNTSRDVRHNEVLQKPTHPINTNTRILLKNTHCANMYSHVSLGLYECESEL
jgi:hypothetical protein